MASPAAAAIAAVLEKRGWPTGTTLENRAARLLSSVFTLDQVKCQHRVGRYRIDFAWPKYKIAMEVDGWHHRSPEGAAKDAQRDCELRAEGWVVFRVDDRGDTDTFLEQVSRVAQIASMFIKFG